MLNTSHLTDKELWNTLVNEDPHSFLARLDAAIESGDFVSRFEAILDFVEFHYPKDDIKHVSKRLLSFAELNYRLTSLKNTGALGAAL